MEKLAEEMIAKEKGIEPTIEPIVEKVDFAQIERRQNRLREKLLNVKNNTVTI